MIYKVLKPSGKDDIDKRENLTNKRRSKGLSNGKKSRAKLNTESPASLDAFSYFGKDIGDPQVKLKLLELTHKNPGEEVSAGILEFVRHMTSVIEDKKCPVVNENSQRCSVKGKKKCEESLEKVTRNDGIHRNLTAKIKKVEISKKPWELKSKSYISESSRRKSFGKIVSKSSERKVNGKTISRTVERRIESKISNKIQEKQTDYEVVIESPERQLNGKTVSRSPERWTEYKTISESSERPRDCKTSNKSLERSYESGGQLPERKRKESPQRPFPQSPRKRNSLSQSAKELGIKKISRRSEIPLLKSRQISKRKIETVSLLMQKPLQENDSSTSINLCSDFKRPPKDDMDITPALEIILQADCSSSKLVDIGGDDFESSPTAIQSTNVPVASRTSYTATTDRRAVKTSKPRTLDLERMKTSSFTVLRTESDGFSRLESFHKQNITAKETARAEIAIKASKIMVMTSKTSFSSLKSKKNSSVSSGGKGNKPNAKKSKNKSEESNTEKKMKMSDTPHLDICKEIMATGKVGCLIPKRVNEKDNEILGVRDKSPPSVAPEYGDKMVSKAVPKPRLKSKEYLKKNKSEKVHKSSKEMRENKPFPVNNEPVDSLSKSSVGRPSNTVIAEREPDFGSQENISVETPEEEVKLEARELAGLVVTGTALNFDDLKIFEKPPEMDKIKLEIKIDVPSEEDVADTEAIECDPNGKVNSAYLDWLLRIKAQSNEKQVLEKEKTSKDDFSSWDWFTEEPKTEEFQVNEAILQETNRSLSSIKRKQSAKTSINIALEEETPPLSGDRIEDSFDCSIFFQSENKPEAKVRSGLTRSCNQEEKMFEDLSPLKLKRRNSEPYSLRGFIWKRADVATTKNLKNSVSSVASSLKHLNTDEMDDFILWEAVPQKMTSCWEMSLYHFKRPWSVLSCSVFKDNRRSSTPGLILDTLRSGGVTNLRRPVLYQNDRINRHKGNIFDVEPSISQKNIDIRNWLAALNFTTPISNTSDIISEGNFSTLSVMDTQKQTNLKRRNVVPQIKSPDKIPDKKIFRKEKHRKLDKWNISDMDGLKELIRRKSGSYVTKEQFILSELSSPKSTMITNACIYSTPPEHSVLSETGDQNSVRKAKVVKSVETSCHLELQEEADIPQKQMGYKDASASSSSSFVGSFKREMGDLPPEFNIWKYLFLFTLMFIIFQHSLRNEAINYS